MKMIAPKNAFFTSTYCRTKKTFVPQLERCTSTLFFYVLFFLTCFLYNTSFGQVQTIGSFPEMQGGIENQAISTLPVGSASYASGATVTTFSRNNNTSSVVVDILGTNGNSGPKSINWAAGSTSAAIFTPTAAVDAVLSNTSYVVQFFARKNTSTTARQFNVRVYTNGANFTEVATVQTGTTSYQKFTAIITTPTDAATGKTGYVGIKPKGGSFGTGLTYLLDDICMYAGSAVDVTAPADATAPTITSASSTTLGVGWTAPVTGVDGGGYVVVRYATNPVSEPAPTANGIYGVGNTIGTGTVAYIGTGTGFTDAGLTANTTYYYKVYVADKAFNYSPTPLTVAGYTGLANPTAVTFTTPAGCATDRLILSWTGPLSYSSANNTILAFLRQTTAVNAGTPTSSPTTYTASTVFSSPVLPAYQNDAAAYCIYKGDGTNAAGDHSGLTITGLLPGTTYQLLMYNVLDAGPTYPISGGVTATGATLAVALAEPTNQPTLFVKGTVSTINIAPSWTAAVAGAQAPTGYYLQISNTATPADAGATSPLDATDVADQTNVTTGTANVKTNASPYAGFTGFTAGTMYYLRNNSYTNTGSCINYKAGGPIINVATLPNEVTVPSMSLSGTTGTISWTAAAGYNTTNHTTLVFVRATTAVNTGTPTANPSTYTASTVFSSPSTFYQLDGAATCVYKGDGTTVNITGLTAGVTYYVLILTVVDAVNSDATNSYSIYTTTSATSGAIYTWNSGITAGAWTTSTNWTPTRTTPAATDILVFSTGETITPTSIPTTQTIAQLQIIGNTTLIYKAVTAGLKTLTITSNNGLLNSDLIINVGSTLTIDKTAPGTTSIVLGANTTADISGNLIVANGTTYNTSAAGDITTVSGLLKNVGTVTTSATNNMVVTSTGTYEHALNGLVVPTANWNTGSTCLISGIIAATTLTGLRQDFSNFVWDCAGQTTNPFVLGASTTNALPMNIGNNFIVKRTGSGLLQITSTGGQKDFSCVNYYQYGGTVAITYNTSDGGLVRSLTVNNLFYVNDSLASGNSKFQIINNPGGSTNISGRLIVKGNIDMNIEFTSSVLEAYKDNTSNPSIAELWFTGTTAQAAKFSTISGNIDFITSNTGGGVTLNSNATASKFKLTQGPFYIDANTLTINDAVSYPAPGTGTLGGINTSNLTLGLNGTTGTLNFISGFRVLKNFTQLASNTVTLGTELAITAGTNAGRDSLGTGAVLNTNDNLILSSDINGTARMAQLTTATINGKVTVERYLPMDLTATARRWRLLTAPFKTTNAPTINAAWQEGQSCPDRTNPYPYDPKPGYGTHITKSTTWVADGYDQGSTANSSLFYYSAGTWVAPANTNVVKITDNSGAYMLFARGDRSTLIAGTNVVAAPTTLDPKGELNIGNVSVPMITSTAYQTIGNPYASQIKLDNIDFNGTLGKSKTVYLWDPKTAGSFNVGKFISCAGNGLGGYTYSANTSGYSNGVIEPSNAFLVQGIGSAGNIVFHETDKTFTSSTVGIASRPVLTPNQFGVIRSFYAELHVIKNGVPLLADGIASTFNRNYNNTIDNFDATKLSTFNTKEVLSIKSNNQLLSIERRKNIVLTDTIFLQITNLNQTTYQFIFKPALFNATFNALLEDSYLGTTTPISLTQNTAVSFNITNEAASAMVNRFKIILYKNQPIKNIALSAALVNNNVDLNWASTDDEDVTATTIERSKDGNAFTALTTTTPLPTAAGALAYNWVDENIVWGNYQYRIKYIDIEGKTAYSNIATITKNNNTDKPAIVPNPASNGQINLNMGNLPKGSYTTKVCNSLGQEIFKGKFDYEDEQSKVQIALPIQQGMYYITLLHEDKAVTTLHFLML